MDESVAPLNLVSFVSGSFGHTLRAALQAFGQQIRNIEGSVWLAGGFRPIDGLTILALGTDDLPRDQLLYGLRARRLAPALGVIPRDRGCWDAEILAYCPEFIRWPCQREELLLRLARGCNGMPPSPTRSPSYDPLEEFADLNLVGQSPAFLSVLQLIRKIARHEVPVLLRGETGTGKEVVARAVHCLGPRRDRLFVAVNCGALPDYLVENELFGHERGAYTDAKDAQAGLIAQAHGGTLFLDEVELLSPKAQGSLLRFLQNQVYQPLGGRCSKQADVRLIAATNADLPALIARREFRQDLWFRLQVMSLALPPLRERRGDVEQLAQHFLSQYSARYQQPAKTLHPATLTWMNSYAWPGNVRELENFVHRLFLLSEGPFVCLPANALACEGDPSGEALLSSCYQQSFSEAKAQAIAEFEKRYLEWLMAECRGNISLAARRAVKERRALGKLLAKYRIDKAIYR